MEPHVGVDGVHNLGFRCDIVGIYLGQEFVVTHGYVQHVFPFEYGPALAWLADRFTHDVGSQFQSFLNEDCQIRETRVSILHPDPGRRLSTRTEYLNGGGLTGTPMPSNLPFRLPRFGEPDALRRMRGCVYLPGLNYESIEQNGRIFSGSDQYFYLKNYIAEADAGIVKWRVDADHPGIDLYFTPALIRYRSAGPFPWVYQDCKFSTVETGKIHPLRRRSPGHGR